MKKYQHTIFILILIAYGWLFYQKNYSGPDINDYLRAKNSRQDSFSILFLNPEKIIGQSKLFYGEFKENFISPYGYTNEFSDIIFFNKDQSNLQINCTSEEIRVQGVIQKQNEHYYFDSIENIMGYDNNKSSQRFGMLTPCY